MASEEVPSCASVLSFSRKWKSTLLKKVTKNCGKTMYMLWMPNIIPADGIVDTAGAEYVEGTC
jgi:hypothetical protein